jgi:tryptophanyl-tRNA synthetase
MSKSYDNTVNLSDPVEVVKKKIVNMVTDPKRIKVTDPGHPKDCNVHAYYAVFVPEMKDEVAQWCSSAKVGCVECKKILAEKMLEKLAPFHKRRQEFAKDAGKIRQILEAGKDKAREAASATLKEARKAMHINL